MKSAFDTQKYLAAQTAKIKERLSKFDNKLYLEFGGKLLYDGHAQRVLPGYEPDAKVQLLKKLKHLEIIYCISAKDIQRGRIRHDFGLTYDLQALKEIGEIRAKGLKVSAVVITRFENEPLALRFKKLLDNSGNKVYIHTEIKGYPSDLKKILGKEGFGKQPFIPTTAPLIVITGAGGGSGKMAVCMSQIFHEQSHQVNAGYAKFETFPIWNLPLNHPVNVAYEAATADLGDVNLVDPFHLRKYGKVAINYNRDIENFQILKKIMKAITTKDNFVNHYNSPTDMGVNMAKEGIVNDKLVQKNAQEEIIRRYLRYQQEYLLGVESKKTVDYIAKIMAKSKLKVEDYALVREARKAKQRAIQLKEGNEGIFCGAAIELADGRMVHGNNSAMFHAESAAIIKALKLISGIPEKQKLLGDKVVHQMQEYKKQLGYSAMSLNAEETITLLGIIALFEPELQKVVSNLGKLKNLNMHITHIPQQGDEEGLKKLKLNVTTDSEMGLLPYYRKR